MARFRSFCEISFGGPCAVTTLTAFSFAIWRKGGPRGDFAWEPVRVRIARTYHLLMDLRGRPCSKTPTLPCVPEGGSFFAAAARVGERAPSETIERYAFLRVRRACASVLGSRKSLIFNGFVNPLVRRGESKLTNPFGACAARFGGPFGAARAGLGALSYDFYFFVRPVTLRAPYSKLMEV